MLTSKIYEKWDRQPCGCGETAKSCPFWGPVLAAERDRIDGNREEVYARLAEGFSGYFGDDVVLVDSSKGVRPFEVFSKMSDIEVKVVHLIRDVRSWSTSQHRRLVETIPEYRDAPIKTRAGRRLARSYFMLFRDWMRRNQKIESAIHTYGWPLMTLGYEQLALEPHNQVPKLCDFIGIDYTDEMLVPANSTSHVAVGNMMRSSVEKMRRIAYDDRWFRNRRLDVPVACMKKTMRWNDARVYGDHSKSMWEAKGYWELQRSTAAPVTDVSSSTMEGGQHK